MELVGQKKLLSTLDLYSFDSFPRSSILIGSIGSGKHTILNYLASKFKLPALNITDKISDEFIDAIYRAPTPCIYFFEAYNATLKEQNILLKLLEEPTNGSFIIVLAENSNILLPTVINRCIIFSLDLYSKKELSLFLDDNQLLDMDLILNVCTTPGQLLATKAINFKELKELCEKIVDKIHLAHITNTLSLEDKINFNDEYDKYPFNEFFKMLIYVITDKLITSWNPIFDKYLIFIIDQEKKLIDRRLNKKLFFENFLISLWTLSKENR